MKKKTAINPEDPLVNYRVGKHVTYEPLPNRKLILNEAPPPPPKAVLNYRGVEAQAESLTAEDEKMWYNCVCSCTYDLNFG